MSALAQHTSVPVAQPLLLCEDAAVIGTPFYLMEHVAGRIFWEPTLPELSRLERKPHYAAMVGALRKLAQKNLSNLTPHPWFSAFHYSHPTLVEREGALAKL